jgi:hypothetical protein
MFMARHGKVLAETSTARCQSGAAGNDVSLGTSLSGYYITVVLTAETHHAVKTNGYFIRYTERLSDAETELSCTIGTNFELHSQ